MTDWQINAPRLRTILRPPSRPANRQRVALYKPEQTLFAYPVAPFLDALIVIDEPNTRRFVTEKMVAEWAITPDVLLRQGLSNLAPADGLRQSKEHQGLWMLKPADGYASARLLMPGWLDAFNDKCVGQPIATAPIAGVVLIADTGRPEALAALVEQSWALYASEAVPLSPVPYFNNDHLFSLRPWTAPEGHALEAELTRAFLYLAGNEYAHQQPLLSEWAETQTPKPFIAPFLMMKREGSLGGLTVMPDRPALLPMATWVRVGTDDPKAEAPLKPWPELVEGGLIRAPEDRWNPPRWAVG